MLRHFRHQDGVTLIELMIGVALIGLLTLMAVPAFQTFMRNTEIRNTGDSVINGIQVARTEAIRRNVAVEIVFGPGTGWTIQIPSTGEKVEEHPDGVGTGTVTLVMNDNDSDWAADDAADRVTFNGMGWRVNNADASPTISRVDIHNTTAGKCQHDENGTLRCLRVLVTTGGASRMCDPSVDPSKFASDPRACPKT
ncbi:MAG TPA: GspH/FimT family pseudopilin [Burkholderiales bacterium]|jgi:type IV fimbrial biogenesis protein FimT|nr:GspH/FimT family pseudopilin [Burkholderiales bacterium]